MSADAPTPLDLDAIRVRADARRDYADERPESLHVPEDYAALADESAADVPALVEEVKRLRAEVATERAEVKRLRTTVGDCHCDKNPETTNGPEEDCPQHGRPVAEVWDLVKGAEAGWDRARAEVDRLCAEARLANASARSAGLALGARLTARPAPAWDEEVVAEAVATALHGDGCPEDPDEGESCACSDYLREARIAVAVVRDHQPVKPSREAVARALALAGDYDGCFERLDAWAAASAEARECGDVEEPMSTDGEDAEWWLKRADAVLSLLPGRSEATVKAEALRDFAARVRDEMDASDKALGTEWATGEYRHAMRSALMQVDEEADRLAAEGGADRG